MAVAAVLEPQSEPADTSEDGLYEFVLNTDGSTTKITHKNSKGRRCKKCGCRCLFFISFFLMLLMAISLMMIIIMIFYPNLSKGVLKLSRILNNNRLLVMQ
jgi:hypothetical protein